MSQFQIGENTLRYYDAQKFPHGYAVICSSNPLDKNSAYWGTVSVYSNDVSTKFQFTIDGLDKAKKRYEMSIFGDKEFLSCLLTVTIFYVDDSLDALDHHVTEFHGEFIPPEIYKLIHLLVYNSALFLPVVYARRPEIDPRSYMEEGYCIYFQKGFKERFETSTKVSLETMISTLNLLLG
ncbi:MAG: hypothetical protein V4524_01275 [Patescibacteria group bacterium]